MVMSKIIDNSDIETALEDCQSALRASNCPFGSWEKDFIASVAEQYESRGSLSEKQMAVLQRIWDKV
jgi:hypothetical protein